MALAVVLGSLLAVAPAGAQPYRWVDEHGTVHYTDDINKVPARFRPKEPPAPPTRRDPFAPVEPGGPARPRVILTPEPASPGPPDSKERR
ncbi:MAG: DUF4124 domain-containing protein [Candidatus Rokubacteria bacterium]|nr:DUF4124 domain-containing protein [Candidatus Rokubacteria bacterium]